MVKELHLDGTPVVCVHETDFTLKECYVSEMMMMSSTHIKTQKYQKYQNCH